MADSSVDNGASSKPCYSASSSNHSGRELDKVVAALTGLKNPIVIAKVNADKYTRLASKNEIEYASLASYHVQL